MESKIMLVFYDNDCLPYKDQARQVHYPVIGTSFTGASNTTQIRFYVNEIGGISNTTWVAVAKLPSGKKLYKQLSVATDTSITPNEQYAYLDLSSAFLSEKGDLLIALNGYAGGVDIVVDEDSGLYTITGSPIIQATGSIKISNGYTPYMDSNYGSVDMLSVQEALSLVSSKLNITDGIIVEDDISLLSASSYNVGQLIYSKEGTGSPTHHFFKVANSGSSNFFEPILFEENVIIPSDGMLYLQNGADFILGDHMGLYFDNSGNVRFYTTDTNYALGMNSSGYLRMTSNVIQHSNDTYSATLPSETGTLQLHKDTLSGYGITDAYTKTQVDNALNLKADKSTTYTKTEVDDLVSTIKSGEVVLVNTTTYPTLQSFLASTGVEGTIYLYPINTSDLSQGYYRYIWEDVGGTEQWLSLGTTEIDLSDYYTSTQVDNLLSDKVAKTLTIAGIDLQDNITAQELTDSLVFASNTDIDNLFA